MRTAALSLILLALVAGTSEAQGRGRNSQGIPPGQMPPAGQCRVWYEGVPPGRQPRAMDCRDAERIASRDRGARVIKSWREGPKQGSSNSLNLTVSGGNGGTQ